MFAKVTIPDLNVFHIFPCIRHLMSSRKCTCTELADIIITYCYILYVHPLLRHHQKEPRTEKNIHQRSVSITTRKCS